LSSKKYKNYNDTAFSQNLTPLSSKKGLYKYSWAFGGSYRVIKGHLISSSTYPFFCQQPGALLKKERGLVPDVGVVAETIS
jgi:hypothetical protein